jgi:hypothetical protein
VSARKFFFTFSEYCRGCGPTRTGETKAHTARRERELRCAPSTFFPLVYGRIAGNDARLIRHLAENFAAQPMSNLAECDSLRVREPQPPFQLGLQDAVFGRQIFIS